MENRFLKGTIAGVIAGIVKDIPNGFIHIFPTLNALAFCDYAGLLAFGRLSRNFPVLLYPIPGIVILHLQWRRFYLFTLCE